MKPSYYAAQNGSVVAALLAAWSAVSRATSLADRLQRAVAGGGDTHTVAAMAGALLGARFGDSTVPFAWRRAVHSWPGLRYRAALAVLTCAAAGRTPTAGRSSSG